MTLSLTVDLSSDSKGEKTHIVLENLRIIHGRTVQIKASEP